VPTFSNLGSRGKRKAQEGPARSADPLLPGLTRASPRPGPRGGETFRQERLQPSPSKPRPLDQLTKGEGEKKKSTEVRATTLLYQIFSHLPAIISVWGRKQEVPSRLRRSLSLTSTSVPLSSLKNQNGGGGGSRGRGPRTTLLRRSFSFRWPCQTELMGNGVITMGGEGSLLRGERRPRSCSYRSCVSCDGVAANRCGKEKKGEK